MQRHHHPVRRVAATLSVAALVFAGAACSASGDDAGPTTTTTADDGTTTTGDATTTSADATTTTADGTTTTTAGGGGGDLGDLEALLPTVDSLPLGYDVVTDDEDDDSDTDDTFQEDMRRACPDAAALLDDAADDDDDGEVSRAFATEQNQEIEVTIGPVDDSSVSADQVIEAINSCSVVETELDGTPATIELQADTLELGDEGLQMEMLISFSFNGTPVEISFTGFEFHRDGIAVEVSASSGLEDDLTTVPGDPDVAYGLAATIDETIVG